MRRALALASRGWGQTAPNPMVGAVVVHGDHVVGEGYHAVYGGPHAETTALAGAGDRARGSTVYVTLEPCDHFGKTPPCTSALISAGVRRVVAAVSDPTPAGGGAEKLRANGIDVMMGVEEDAARELNAAFFHAAVSDRPWIVLKLATTREGFIAPPPGDADAPRWFTGPESRAEVHRLRAGSDAIAVGVGTVCADDPQLTVRDWSAPRKPPARIIFDRSGRTPLESRVVRSARSIPTFVVTGETALVEPLRERGVEIVRAASLPDALRELRGRGIRSILVEGGARIAAALLDAESVDRMVLIESPVSVHEGGLHAFAHVHDDADPRSRMQVLERRDLGDDVITVYRAPR